MVKPFEGSFKIQYDEAQMLARLNKAEIEGWGKPSVVTPAVYTVPNSGGAMNMTAVIPAVTDVLRMMVVNACLIFGIEDPAHQLELEMKVLGSKQIIMGATAQSMYETIVRLAYEVKSANNPA